MSTLQISLFINILLKNYRYLRMTNGEEEESKDAGPNPGPSETV